MPLYPPAGGGSGTISTTDSAEIDFSGDGSGGSPLTAALIALSIATGKIGDNQVTFAKVQDISVTDRLLGRDTGGSGDIEEIAVGGGLEFTGASGIRIANDGVTTARILNDNVTYAKIQNVSATDRLLGRDTAGAGDVEEIAPAAVRTMLDVPTKADVHGVERLLPTGALAQVGPRIANFSNLGTILATGRLVLVGIWLPAGITVTTISFRSATTAAGTPTNQWFALFDSSRAKLEVTNDDTTTAWAAQSVKTLTLASTHVTTYEGLHYIGICVVATTTPTLTGYTASILDPSPGGSVPGPILCGTSDTGLTNPASCPATAAALAAVNAPYAYVS